MADDDIVIGRGDTIPGVSAYAHVVVCVYAELERQITDGRVAGSGGVV